jgi:AcrR family transcriptional regulator
MNHIAEVSLAAASDAPADPRTDARSRTDTRARIQQVAVELFTSRGYDGTSLREIAERLGVTKAALYYHFKSKEDIIQSLVEDYQGQMDGLIDLARSEPRTAGTRREIVARYVDIVAEGDQVFRMLHQNQAVLNTMASAVRTLKTAPRRLVDQLVEPDAPLRERARMMMVLGAISIGWMQLSEQVHDRHELSEVVSSLASEFARCEADPGEPDPG